MCPMRTYYLKTGRTFRDLQKGAALMLEFNFNFNFIAVVNKLF